MKKICLYMLLLIVIFFSCGKINAKADSWAEPVRRETVKRTTTTTKVKMKTKAAKSTTVVGQTKTVVKTSTRISNGKKVVTTRKTVTQDITKKTKGSKIQVIVCTKTITTTTDTYRYYYNLDVGISQKGRTNIKFSLDRLLEYLPKNQVDLLKKLDVRIYLYSDEPILQKYGIVGVSVWGSSEKAAYIKEDKWYVILHETAHLLDCYAAASKCAANSYYSESSYFKKVFQKDRSKVQGSYSTSIREYFAESFMYYYLRPTTLKQERPDTYEAIRKFVASLSKS